MPAAQGKRKTPSSASHLPVSKRKQQPVPQEKSENEENQPFGTQQIVSTVQNIRTHPNTWAATSVAIYREWKARCSKLLPVLLERMIQRINHSFRPIEGPFPELCSICGKPACEAEHQYESCGGICGRRFHSSCLSAQAIVSFSDSRCSDCQKKSWSCFFCKKVDPDPSNKISQCPFPGCRLFFHKTCMQRMQPDLPKSTEKILREMKRSVFSTGKKKKNPLICSRHRCVTCVEMQREPRQDAEWNPEKQLVICRKCPNAVHANRLCFPADFRRNEFDAMVMTCCDHDLYETRFTTLKDMDDYLKSDAIQREFFVSLEYQSESMCVVCAGSESQGLFRRCWVCSMGVHTICIESSGGLSTKSEWTCRLCTHSPKRSSKLRKHRQLIFVNDTVWHRHPFFKIPWPCLVVSLDDFPESLVDVKQLLDGTPAIPLFYPHWNYYTFANPSELVAFHSPVYGDSFEWMDYLDRAKPKNHLVSFKSRKTDLQTHLDTIRSFRDKVLPESHRLRSSHFNYYPTPYHMTKTSSISGPGKKRPAAESEADCDCDDLCEANCPCRSDSADCDPSRCGCGPQCHNRFFSDTKVRKPKLRVDHVGAHGWGLFADEAIVADQPVMEYAGRLRSVEQHRISEDIKSLLGVVHHYSFELAKKWYIDAEHEGNETRFLNHSCDPNCAMYKWNTKAGLKLGVFTSKDISQGQELTIDYGYTCEEGEDPGKCCCGSSKCRGDFRSVVKKK